jgi:hypothetical protein
LSASWFALRPGSVLAPLPERMAYLASRPLAWSLGWGIWMLCALVLVAFMAALRRRVSGDPFLAGTGSVWAKTAEDLPFEASPPDPLSVTGEGGKQQERLGFAPLSRQGEGPGVRPRRADPLQSSSKLNHDFLAQLALVLTAAGVAVDLLCEAIQIQVLPAAAAAGPSNPDLFLAFERLAFTGGVTVANGLYTLGLLLMNLCLHGIAGAPARLAGWISVLGGLALAVAGFVPSPLLLQAATGTTILFYSLWAVLVSRDLRAGR